ncbi:hypothetical protein HZA33_02105 [Candidatus Pacearchaeota archaeon]|nr:hypothetical protein [Candidatus Pacearchaeota archaeon]
MKLFDMVLGIVVLFLGVFPYLVKVAAISKIFGFIGKPGDTIFNVILIAAGVLLIGYGMRRPAPMMIRR